MGEKHRCAGKIDASHDLKFMCGICGKLTFGASRVDVDLLEEMNRTIAYRGPDDAGVKILKDTLDNGKPVQLGLGHQRLSIIDLSSAGHQPMSNEDGSIWITYNGEIYNYKSIRSELIAKGHTFRSDTDTEVIIHLYEEEGVAAVKRLNGMFAFALWDSKKGILWLCRDRVGIKPLVYYWDDQQLIFASEIKAILKDPDVSKKMDMTALNLYMAFSFIPAPKTIFEGIRKLPPGHSLVIQKGKIRTQSYWEAPKQVGQAINNEKFKERRDHYSKMLYRTLSDAVTSRMVADVPLGAFLSGGIDSSVVVALMALQSSQPIKTFSIGFTDAPLYDETHYAREVATRYKTDHHEFKLTFQDMIDVLPDVMSTFDEPFSDSSAIPAYIVSRETRQHVTVALSGDGGDELFAGYRSYLGHHWYQKYMMIPAILRESVLENFIKTLPDSRDSRCLEFIRRAKKFVKGTKGSFPERLLALKEVMSTDLRKKILKFHSADNDGAFGMVSKRVKEYKGDTLNSVLYSDFKDSLPGDMLNKVDWMSMKNSLEVRVPFLDHRVVELAFGMPGSLKIHRGKTKYILKETFKDLLPRSLYTRPKAGFEVPISKWLRTDLKFLVDKYLSEEKIRDQGLFEYDIISGLKESHQNLRSDTSWMLWNLIVFQFWYDRYFTA
jgi:asparagine synthase (glutamine-hydrolysing)